MNEQSGLYQALAAKFREAGVNCEVFLEETPVDKLTKQFILAEKKGIRMLIIPGENPLTDPMTVRDIKTRQNHDCLYFKDALRMIINGL